MAVADPRSARVRPLAAAMAWLLAGSLPLVAGTGGGAARDGRQARPSGAAAARVIGDIQIQQGFHVKAWIGSNGTIGQGAFDDFLPPDGVGMEYPVGSRVEHLYGAGIWVGAIVDTGAPGAPSRIAAVTKAYNWGETGVQHEMYGYRTARDTFFVTGVDASGSPNLLGFDDDGDGGIDEDPQDGYDNDGDWRPAFDDVGSDGVPDSLEVGCRGPYDAVANPDPAHDNFSIGALDVCRPDRSGYYPRQNDRYLYTERNGEPDAGEPGVDEDYGAVSERDVSIAYSDVFEDPLVPGHIPLGIRVWQKSYAWRNLFRQPILPLEYAIVNAGGKTLDSVYIAFFVDPLIGNVNSSDIAARKYSAYIPELRTGYAHNVYDRSATPVGVVVLGTPRPLSQLRYTFNWNRFEDNPGTDAEHYALMSSGRIKPDEPENPGSDSQFLLSFGPFETMHPGDTLRVAVALVSGDGVDIGPNSLRENARRAYSLYASGYRLPVTPPSPPLSIVQGAGRVDLDWTWKPGSPLPDPLQTWDDSSAFLSSLPDSHWRRADPPAGRRTGGRIFEGFRLWRSESPEFDPATFSLVRQFDVDDDLGFEFDSGLEFSFTDSNLLRGKKYWYAVTSFGIPGVTVNVIPLPDAPGSTRTDTLFTPPLESDPGQNATLVQLPFSPSRGPGQAIVVPNPYRVDANYTFESGGWEGRGFEWNEWKRTIWFIHLPERAVIRIFSLTGDVVATIHHDDAVRTGPGRPAGQEEWDMMSESGRVIASGVYVFSVESEYGTQIGTFAVIR